MPKLRCVRVQQFHNFPLQRQASAKAKTIEENSTLDNQGFVLVRCELMSSGGRRYMAKAKRLINSLKDIKICLVLNEAIYRRVGYSASVNGKMVDGKISPEITYVCYCSTVGAAIVLRNHLFGTYRNHNLSFLPRATKWNIYMRFMDARDLSQKSVGWRDPHETTINITGIFNYSITWMHPRLPVGTQKMGTNLWEVNVKHKPDRLNGSSLLRVHGGGDDIMRCIARNSTTMCFVFWNRVTIPNVMDRSTTTLSIITSLQKKMQRYSVRKFTAFCVYVPCVASDTNFIINFLHC